MLLENCGPAIFRNIYFKDNMAEGNENAPGASQNLDALGGALYLRSSNPQLIACHFEDNSATGATPLIAVNGGRGSGGAIFCQNSSPSLTDCVFTENCAIGGQGGTAPMVEQEEPGTAGAGGTVAKDAGDGGTGNPGGDGDDGYAGGLARGGAIYADTTSSLMMSACAFQGNQVHGGRGGNGGNGGRGGTGGRGGDGAGLVFLNGGDGGTGGRGGDSGAGGSPGHAYGGAIVLNGGTSGLSTSLFEGNFARTGLFGTAGNGGQGGTGGRGGNGGSSGFVGGDGGDCGIGGQGGNSNAVYAGVQTLAGGAIYSNSVILSLESCGFVGNNLISYGTPSSTGSAGAKGTNGAAGTGAGGTDPGSNGSCSGSGSGGSTSSSGEVSILSQGGAIAAFTSTLDAKNLTLAANEALRQGQSSPDGTGAALYQSGSSVTINDTLFLANRVRQSTDASDSQPIGQWNSAPSGTSPQIATNWFYDTTTDSSLGYPAAAVRRIPSSGDGDWETLANNDYGDLRLQSSSPLRNTGVVVPPTLVDLDGNDRINEGLVDIGAYEYYATFALEHSLLDPGGDDNNNGVSNFAEYAAGLDPTASGNPPITTSFSDANERQLTVLSRNNAADISFTLQKSTTLLPDSWDDMIPGVDYTINSESISGSTTTQTLDLLTADSKLFFREFFSETTP